MRRQPSRSTFDRNDERNNYLAGKEAYKIGLIVSKQDQKFGTNMLKELKPSDEPRINQLMDLGHSRIDAMKFIFDIRFPTEGPDNRRPINSKHAPAYRVEQRHDDNYYNDVRHQHRNRNDDYSAVSSITNNQPVGQTADEKALEEGIRLSLQTYSSDSFHNHQFNQISTPGIQRSNSFRSNNFSRDHQRYHSEPSLIPIPHNPPNPHMYGSQLNLQNPHNYNYNPELFNLPPPINVQTLRDQHIYHSSPQMVHNQLPYSPTNRVSPPKPSVSQLAQEQLQFIKTQTERQQKYPKGFREPQMVKTDINHPVVEDQLHMLRNQTVPKSKPPFSPRKSKSPNSKPHPVVEDQLAFIRYQSQRY